MKRGPVTLGEEPVTANNYTTASVLLERWARRITKGRNYRTRLSVLDLIRQCKDPDMLVAEVTLLLSVNASEATKRKWRAARDRRLVELGR